VSDAVAALVEIINEKRRNDTDPDACEGLARWFEESWGVGKAVHVRAVAQAMADYIAARVASGGSQRSVRALQSDLQLAGLLYFHSWRASKKALDDFRSGIAADEIEFRRKASDAPAQVARYLKAVDDFQRYLKG
jgi:hypothetical protein